jgi:hypothetical protein
VKYDQWQCLFLAFDEFLLILVEGAISTRFAVSFWSWQ